MLVSMPPSRLGRSAVAGFALLMAVCGAPIPPAFAADAAKGEIIAKRWCATCHVTAPDQTTSNTEAPSFASIAARTTSPNSLKAFLADPHPRMPNMSLTTDEIADIVAYLMSQRQP
ncbi:cytochrome c class I [Methylocella silvestris BL2]|uniref:Cytochrome c class I n=1 Tax=Methylocella silvestris (strain DSM 15510 / CIP 108128 / LMG 27833 / NCIMB 13906 / BL2) TaxID=395965 RepID=B8EME5_METSB|nr:c-type cytochrome [Methylocella silvestris]ACK52073.1 cytochrome c class I [Methylocella silvestris BL2]